MIDDYEIRQQARRWFVNGFLNKQMDYKLCTGDDALLTFYHGIEGRKCGSPPILPC